jgi:hypothetical protein
VSLREILPDARLNLQSLTLEHRMKSGRIVVSHLIVERERAASPESSRRLYTAVFQKFSIIHMLLFQLEPLIARWRPSGEGTPHDVLLLAFCSHKTSELPCKSTCNTTAPRRKASAVRMTAEYSQGAVWVFPHNRDQTVADGTTGEVR